MNRSSKRFPSYLAALATTAAFLLPASPAFATATTCADKVVIKQVLAGYVDAHKGPDSGNAFAVGYYDMGGNYKELMMNRAYNLNDTPGPALLSLLMMAQATGQLVTLKDHDGTRCDDFDEIILHGY